MAVFTTLANLPHFLSSFTSLEIGALALFLAAVFTAQLILLRNCAGRRRWMPLILSAGALLVMGLGIQVITLFPDVFFSRGWDSPMLLVYSVFLLLLYFAWMALFAALLALMIHMILKKSRT